MCSVCRDLQCVAVCFSVLSRIARTECLNTSGAMLDVVRGYGG